MTAERLAAVGLLGAAAAGGAAAVCVPRRFGRPGRLAVTAGVAILLLRDAGMVGNGVPRRLKTVPRALLYLELTCAGLASVLGAAAWVRASGSVADGVKPARAVVVRPDRAADYASALTFALHALRQAVYLTPGQGRLETRSGTTLMHLGESR